MSSARPREFFLDRSLGRVTATRLRDAEFVVHLIADHYPSDARKVADEVWIAEGCSRGWILLTKDQKIRYRATELAALHDGHLFCLAAGNANLDQMATAFLSAMPAIERAVHRHALGFWHVYLDGRIRRMWP